MDEKHLAYLQERHPEIYSKKIIPREGFLLVEALYEKKGGVITDDNPEGELRVKQKEEFIVLVGKSSWLKPGDRVFIPESEIYPRIPEHNGVANLKGQIKKVVSKPRMVPNPKFVPPFFLGDNPPDLHKGDPYVMLVQDSNVLFVYGE